MWTFLRVFHSLDLLTECKTACDPQLWYSAALAVNCIHETSSEILLLRGKQRVAVVFHLHFFALIAFERRMLVHVVLHFETFSFPVHLVENTKREGGKFVPSALYKKRLLKIIGTFKSVKLGNYFWRNRVIFQDQSGKLQRQLSSQLLTWRWVLDCKTFLKASLSHCLLRLLATANSSRSSMGSCLVGSLRFLLLGCEQCSSLFNYARLEWKREWKRFCMNGIRIRYQYFTDDSISFEKFSFGCCLSSLFAHFWFGLQQQVTGCCMLLYGTSPFDQ